MRDLYKINRRRIGQQFLWAGYVYTGLETRVQCASAMRSEPNGKVKIIPVYTHVGEKKKKIRSCKSTLQKDNTFLGNHRTDRPSSLQSEGVKAHPNTVAELTIPPGCSEHNCCSCCKSHEPFHQVGTPSIWISIMILSAASAVAAGPVVALQKIKGKTKNNNNIHLHFFSLLFDSVVLLTWNLLMWLK